MMNEEIYDVALREYASGGLQAWLAGQHDDVLCRLYADLSHVRNSTIVIRTEADYLAAATHDGPRVVRDDRKEWFPYCDDICILGDVTEAIGQRLYDRVVRNDGFPAEVFAPLHPCGLDAWRDYLRMLAGKVEWWARRVAAAPGPRGSFRDEGLTADSPPFGHGPDDDGGLSNAKRN